MKTGAAGVMKMETKGKTDVDGREGETDRCREFLEDTRKKGRV